jgi:hypothetical protein
LQHLNYAITTRCTQRDDGHVSHAVIARCGGRYCRRAKPPISAGILGEAFGVSARIGGHDLRVTMSRWKR